MAPQFESGFFVRKPAWHGLGRVVTDAPTVADGLSLAGLDWRAAKQPMYLADGTVCPDQFAIVRDRDNSVLGYGGNNYVIAQPQECFDFMDALISDGVVLDTAGSLFSGKRIFVLAKAPSRKVLGDEVAEYVCVSTSFDGSSTTRCDETPTRVVCANTLALSRLTAKRSWTTRHTGARIVDKVAEAQRVLKLSAEYMDDFTAKAERYAAKKVSSAEFNSIVSEIFGDETSADATTKQKNNIMHLKSQLGVALRRDDLANFKGSAWHLYNAFGDFASHIDPVRKTAEWRDNLWLSFIDGNKTLLTVERMLDEIVA